MRKLWISLGEGKQSDILSILFATLGVILFLALMTHSSTDPSPLARSSEETVSNLIGKPGAWISDLLFQFFGKAAFLIPVLVWIACFSWLRRIPEESALLRIFGAAVTILSGCGLLALFFPQGEAGGMLGRLVSDAASSLGRVGGGIILLALMTASLLVTADIRLSTLWNLLRFLIIDPAGRFMAALREARRSISEKRAASNEEAPVESLPEVTEKYERRRHTTAKLFSPEDDTIEIEENRPAPVKKRPPRPSTPPPKKIVEKHVPEQERTPQETFVPMEDEPDEPQILPALSMLDEPQDTEERIPMDEIERSSRMLERTLQDFGIDARVVGFQRGPVITRYELEPPPGVKVNRITSLTDNLALSLKVSPIRVLAPIPGKGTVGVEVPNKDQQRVSLRQLLESKDFQSNPAKLTIALGKVLSGELFFADLTKMPHLLIAGATGAGKSVCINTIITSILYKATPEEVKFLMIDPKRVELRVYEDIPHLMAPVITDSRRAGAALRWVVEEMEERFGMLARVSCRDLRSYNTKMSRMAKDGTLAQPDAIVLKPFLPYIVVIIDELADLMTYARNDTEVLIASLAQKARAVGIHLVLATQRPSVNVLTGIIKANFPSRIAFQVASKVDSRTILDSNGAEALLGKGDMLFSSAASLRAVRIQGSYVSTEEIERVCDFLRESAKPEYLAKDFEVEDQEPIPLRPIGVPKQTSLFDIPLPSEIEDDNSFPEDVDLFEMAKQIVIETATASTSLLQRRLKIGYGRAARFLDQMEQDGIVGPPRGSRPREVLLGEGGPKGRKGENDDDEDS